MSFLPSPSVTMFAASSIQKPKFSSMLDEVLPLGASTMTTFFVKQSRELRAKADSFETARALNEAGIVECRIGGGDILDDYGMPPVVAEVVGVRKRADAAFDQVADPDIFCVKGLANMIPFRIGDPVSLVADVEPEEVIIL